VWLGEPGTVAETRRLIGWEPAAAVAAAAGPALVGRRRGHRRRRLPCCPWWRPAGGPSSRMPPSLPPSFPVSAGLWCQFVMAGIGPARIPATVPPNNIFSTVGTYGLYVPAKLPCEKAFVVSGSSPGGVAFVPIHSSFSLPALSFVESVRATDSNHSHWFTFIIFMSPPRFVESLRVAFRPQPFISFVPPPHPIGVHSTEPPEPGGRSPSRATPRPRAPHLPPPRWPPLAGFTAPPGRPPASAPPHGPSGRITGRFGSGFGVTNRRPRHRDLLVWDGMPLTRTPPRSPLIITTPVLGLRFN